MKWYRLPVLVPLYLIANRNCAGQIGRTIFNQRAVNFRGAQPQILASPRGRTKGAQFLSRVLLRIRVLRVVQAAIVLQSEPKFEA